ncbi:MAG: hypothetical protein V1865_00905 [bacterium]
MGDNKCCTWHGRFPTLALIIFVVGLVWLLNDLEVFSAEIPWLPIVLMALALGWLIDGLTHRNK